MGEVVTDGQAQGGVHTQVFNSGHATKQTHCRDGLIIVRVKCAEVNIPLFYVWVQGLSLSLKLNPYSDVVKRMSWQILHPGFQGLQPVMTRGCRARSR